MFKICSILGTPDRVRHFTCICHIRYGNFMLINLNYQYKHILQKEWPEGYVLASAMNFKFPKFSKIPLSSVVTGAGKEGITLIEDMLNWCPGKRPTAQQSLR